VQSLKSDQTISGLKGGLPQALQLGGLIFDFRPRKRDTQLRVRQPAALREFVRSRRLQPRRRKIVALGFSAAQQGPGDRL
jgi:hypothetical protein